MDAIRCERKLCRDRRCRVCHLDGCRVGRTAAADLRPFDVDRWSGRRVAVPVAPEAGPTSPDGILLDCDGVVVARWPDPLMRSRRTVAGSSLTSPNVCQSLKNCSGEITPSPEMQRAGGRPLLRRRNAGSMLTAFSLDRTHRGSLNLFIGCGRQFCTMEPQ